MAEKELRKEIEELASELVEVKGELDARIKSLKKKVKPALLVVLGIIGIRIGLKIAHMLMSLVWKLKSFILAGMIFAALKLYLASNKEQ